MCSARIPFATLSGECRKSCSAVCCFSSCTPLYPEEGIATRLTCRLRGLSPVGSGPPHAPLLWSGVGLLICLISPPRKGERLRVSTTYLIPWCYHLGIKLGAPYDMWKSCHKMRQICFYTFRRGSQDLCLISFIIMYSMDMVNKLPILNKASHIPPGCPFGTCSISFTYKDFGPRKWQKKLGGRKAFCTFATLKQKTYHYGTKIHSNA